MRTFSKGHIRGIISKDGKRYYSVDFDGPPDNWTIYEISDTGKEKKEFSSRKDAQMFLESVR